MEWGDLIDWERAEAAREVREELAGKIAQKDEEIVQKDAQIPQQEEMISRQQEEIQVRHRRTCREARAPRELSSARLCDLPEAQLSAGDCLPLLK